MTDSYDQYADQLLNSAFQNARKTPAPAIDTSHEDQLLNQLFQNARYSAPLTPFGNNTSSNEWFLLQQLQQQKMLLERQQQMMSPSVFHQVPIQSTASPAVIIPEEAPAPAKKIARVPVHSDPVVLEDTIAAPMQQQHLNTASAPPPLNKKKSFLRSLSLKRPSNKDLAAAAIAVATTAVAAKSIQHQYQEMKREEQERRREERERKKQEQEEKKSKKRPAKFSSAAVISDYEEEPEVEYTSTPQPLSRKSSFWKPREERPKGWWKGQRGAKNNEEQYEEVEYEEVEEEEEEEVVPVVVAPPVKTKKVVKRVAVPKPVPSIKASKPKRPMAFKQPSPRKSKPEKKKKAGKKGSKGTTSSETTTSAVAQPMYMMPQQMYQPSYYQQPMMMAPQYLPGGYYPQMMGQMPQQQPTQPERKSSPARKKSIYNPRDNANDKCSIM